MTPISYNKDITNTEENNNIEIVIEENTEVIDHNHKHSDCDHHYDTDDIEFINDDTDFIMDNDSDSVYGEFNIEEPYYHDDIYLYQGAWYHRSFPVIWAMTHETGSGPSQCSNCADFGCVNHVFIGYCANCADYYYDGERGKGFIDNGIEFDEFESAVSAFDTYLKGVDISQIKPIYKHVNIDSDSDSDSDESFEYECGDIDYENNISIDCAESVLNQ